MTGADFRWQQRSLSTHNDEESRESRLWTQEARP